MGKLELKHLAPYLPYGLIGRVTLDEDIEDCLLTGITCLSDKNDKQIQCLTKGGLGIYRYDLENENFKPILKPLSDLFVEILINDVKNTHIKNLNQFCVNLVEEHFIEHIFDFSDKLNEVSWSSAPWVVMVYLFENHFDVFGLIEKGLAIDVNTIE